MYYYGARYYDPRISIFISVDPLAKKYPNIGGYVYCVNNPINIIDPDGRDIIILNDFKGANGASHHAVLIGSDKNGWVYISKDGANSKNKMFGPAKYIVKRFDSYSDFYNSNHNKSVKSGDYHTNTNGTENQLSEDDFVYDQFGYSEIRYKRQFRIETKDETSDANSIMAAWDQAKSYYNLGSDDCSDVVSAALNAATSKDGSKIDTANDSNLLNKLPNQKQKNIEKNNKSSGRQILNIETKYTKKNYNKDGNEI